MHSARPVNQPERPRRFRLPIIRQQLVYRKAFAAIDPTKLHSLFTMRIATLQFAPKVGEVDQNIKRADALLRQAQENGGLRGLDILILPEMAFSGYNHPSLNAIRPFLEPTASGPSSAWAKHTAQLLGCIVAVGYPERRTLTSYSADEKDIHVSSATSKDPLDGDASGHVDASDVVANDAESYYNSLVFVSPTGEVVAHYRKTFLYYTDETWATENPDGFFAGEIGLSKPLLSKPGNDRLHCSGSAGRDDDGLKIAAGICMDINPHKFTAPWTAYEFANHCIQTNADIVVLSMAWLTRLSEAETAEAGGRPDLSTVGYWIERFAPLLEPGLSNNVDDEKEVVVVFANRSGEEGTAPLIGDVRYAGSSCVVAIKKSRHPDDEGQVRIWEMLGKATEGVLEVDTTDEAKYYLKTKRRTEP